MRCPFSLRAGADAVPRAAQPSVGGQEEGWMSDVARLHGVVKRGDLAGVRLLLDANRALANSRSETDARGTYPLHVAAEFGQADAARLLLDFR